MEVLPIRRPVVKRKLHLQAFEFRLEVQDLFFDGLQAPLAPLLRPAVGPVPLIHGLL